ncbi:MFS transporter [Micropruina sp.]|uniref:MFS transporter n=1 Tax=Micropruina sp. TaxID=2737536 RepID=UPI0039E5CD56
MVNSSRADRRSTVGVGVLFASNGALFAALLPWYPLLTGRMGLTATEFGLVVASFAVGAIISSGLPPRLIARLGPVRVSLLGTAVLAAAVAAVAWAPTGGAFALALFVAGFVDAIVDVAQNVAGVRVQDAVGRPILSSMHALWSLGGVASGALSTMSAASGADARLHLAILAVSGTALVALGGWLIGPLADNSPSDTADAGPSEAGRRRWRSVAVLALPLVVVAICGTTVEDVANNWAALSGVRLAGLDAAVAGTAFTVTIGSQCVGRFTGDLMIGRFGAGRVARIGGGLIALGGVLIVSATSPLPLIAGLILAGYGSATLVPSAFNAAARLPGIGQGGGVTLISWLMRLGFLATSPIIGVITDSAGLRWGMGILILIGITTVALGGVLDRHGAR